MMKKFILSIVLIVSFVSANSSEVATKDDVKAIRNDIKMLVHQMDKRFELMQNSMDKRFELMQNSIDKRFEQVDKRFEQIDKRFEQIDKRFEQVDKHFEQVDKHFEQVDKRIEQTNRRIELMQQQMERRFEQMETRFNWVMGLIVGGFVFFYRYLLVEHRKLKDDIVKELRFELEKKADKERVEKIVAVIEDFARKDEEFRKILEKHHLKYVA